MERNTLPGLIDTHCHLDMRFDEDRAEVIARAFDNGLEAMITIASDPPSNRAALEIARGNDNIYATIGIHPHDARLLDDNLKNELRNMAREDKVVAIGETGLDYHYDNSPRDIQRDAFRWHLEFAAEMNLPVIIHSREADDDTINILREAMPPRAVLHCFNGSPRLLELARELGIYVSIAGPVTFKKAEELKESVKHVPDELLLIETDSPFLAPIPKRGKRNEPSYVEHTARAIATIRGVTFEDIARITTVNARRAFGLGEPAKGDNITYQIRDSLYLNITNRCTNRCGFCARDKSSFVKGHDMSLSREPSADELISAIGDVLPYDEIVFCGFGEPTLRLDVVKEVAAAVHEQGGRVRLNTNGQGSLVHARDITAELAGLIDEVSVSLDAHDEVTYNKICLPEFPGSYDAVKEFIRACVGVISTVKATIVDMPEVDEDACRAIADELGAELRVRKYDVIG